MESIHFSGTWVTDCVASQHRMSYFRSSAKNVIQFMPWPNVWNSSTMMVAVTFVMQIREVDEPMRGRTTADTKMPDFHPGRFEIFRIRKHRARRRQQNCGDELAAARSEEHTSELQSLRHLVCRLLLGKT